MTLFPSKDSKLVVDHNIKEIINYICIFLGISLNILFYFFPRKVFHLS